MRSDIATRYRQLAIERDTANARRKAETVKKLLALAELVAADGCDLSYHHMSIQGPKVPWTADTQWSKDLLWGGKRTITLTLVVDAKHPTATNDPTNGS